MNSGAVALAIVQPAGPPALWSGAGIVHRIRLAMFHRYEDIYFRPVVQAESILDLRWQVAKLRWRFAAETTAFSLGMHTLKQAGWSIPLRVKDYEEAYEYFQQRLSTSRFSEETIANIDYVIFTAMKFAASLDSRSVDIQAGFTWQQLAKLLDVTNLFNFSMGAVMTAALEPSLVKNPLVVRELALSATRAADAFVVATGELGLTVA